MRRCTVRAFADKAPSVQHSCDDQWQPHHCGDHVYTRMRSENPDRPVSLFPRVATLFGIEIGEDWRGCIRFTLFACSISVSVSSVYAAFNIGFDCRAPMSSSAILARAGFLMGHSHSGWVDDSVLTQFVTIYILNKLRRGRFGFLNKQRSSRNIFFLLFSLFFEAIGKDTNFAKYYF